MDNGFLFLKMIERGWQPLYVGGYVRNYLMGNITSTDIDVEVGGATIEELVEFLTEEGAEPSLVGKEFGVIKAGPYDFSVRRRENKTGARHTDFSISIDPTMSFEEAASRRDFTINAMAMDMAGNILDPFGGQKDLEARLLMPVSKKFLEDPLRVLRGAQFAARFNLVAHDSFKNYACQLLPQAPSISRDRVREEFIKLFRAPHPNSGLNALEGTGWLDYFEFSSYSLNRIVGAPLSSFLFLSNINLDKAGFSGSEANKVRKMRILCDKNILIIPDLVLLADELWPATLAEFLPVVRPDLIKVAEDLNILHKKWPMPASTNFPELSGPKLGAALRKLRFQEISSLEYLFDYKEARPNRFV